MVLGESLIFLFLSNIPLCMYTHQILIIHSSEDWFGLFPSMDIGKNVANWEYCRYEHWCTNIYLSVCFQLFWLYTKKQNWCVIWHFYVYDFEESLYCFTNMLDHFTFIPTVKRVSIYPFHLQKLLFSTIIFFSNKHSNACEEISNWFDLHFPNSHE